MIKGVVFDLDGVYFVKGKDNFLIKLEEMGVNREEAIRVFLKSDEMNKLYKCGQWSDDQYWDWAKKEWGLDQKTDMQKILIEGYEIDQSVMTTIKDLKTKGYKILACSNNFRSRVEGLQKRFKFLDDFDAWVFSYEVGTTKPDLKIYEELVKRSELRADEIVCADDNPDNAAAALMKGMYAFTYRGFDIFLEQLKKLGVETGK